MIQQEHILYKAMIDRDKSYDGLIYYGITSTGIYCRPICPAIKPKRENVLFFSKPEEAAQAGFRACKRCRPESRPGSPAWQGTQASVKRALRLIAQGTLEEGTVENLADKLGMSSRHLRRLFEKHLGKSPMDYATERRLDMAKKLLSASDHAISDIAFTSGFSSLRRFNASFKSATDMTPSAWRQSKAHEKQTKIQH